MRPLIRPMKAGEEAEVCGLVKRCFDEFVGHEYEPEGREEFYKYANASALAVRQQLDHFVLVAETGDEIVGMIEMRGGDHLAMLFVDGKAQRQGVARELFRQALEICRARNPEMATITVNSSRYAVSAYEAMGFACTGPEQTTNGITFVPMALELVGDA